MRSHVTSIFLYACESWTLTAELQRGIQAMKVGSLPRDTTHLIQRPCYQRGSPCQDPQAIGPHEDLLTMVKRRKLKWHGRVSRSSGLAKTIMQGTVKGRRRQSRQKQRLEDNIKEMTGQIPEGSGEQRKMEETGCEVICGAPTPPAVKG